MKRLLPLLALGLVATACGSSRPHPVGSDRLQLPAAPPSPVAFRFSVRSNQAFARGDAVKLMGIVVVPPGARRVPKVPASAPAWFRQDWSTPRRFAGAVDIRRFWVVHRPLKQVVRFIELHLHPRPRPEAPYRRPFDPKRLNRIGSRPSIDFVFPAILGRATTRWLDVTMLALPGGATVVAANAGDQWIHAPPRSAEVPSSVRRIDIVSRYGNSRPSVLVHVRDRYDVGLVVSWMNGLGLAPRNLFCAGQVVGGPDVSLTFRAADGRTIAKAGLPGDECQGFSLTVNGKKAPPLLPSNLLQTIEHHLGLDLSPPKPTDVAMCLRQRDWTVSVADRVLTGEKHGSRTTLTFLPTGKVTVSPHSRPAIARCLRSSPRIGYLG
jgi:hypothetical protein